MPCKHGLAVFEHVPVVSWNSLGEIYTMSLFFSIDYEVFGLTKVTQSSMGSQEDKQVKHEDAVLENDQLSEVGNKKELIKDKELKEIPVKEKISKIAFSCREMLKQIKSMTYIVDLSTALEEPRENLIEIRDNFANYAPTDHGLVIENPKAKQKYEKALKRASYEKIPMLMLKKSKLTVRVGVASEAKRLATSISIPRQASDAPKIQTSEIQLKDTHHAQLLEMNETHFPEKPVKAVASMNDLNTQGKNLVMASRIVNQHPPIPLSSPLLKNGFHTITYLDLLSLETAHTTSQLVNVRKYDKHFKTGWLHDEVINSFLHVLTSNRTEFLLCESSVALVISEGKSFRKLWKDEELSSKSCVFIPFNPNNCHWLLIVWKIHRKEILVLDPLVADTNWSDKSFQKVYRVDSIIMETKFGINKATKANVKHTKQAGSISCGVMICYYADQIINGNTLFKLL